MGNFSHVLALAIKDRVALVSVGVTAILSAILCCASFSMVYPAVEIVCRGKSIPAWLEIRMASQQEALAELEARAGQAGDKPTEVKLQNSLHAARKLLERYEFLHFHAERFLPRTAYGTLLAMAAALLIGTLLKGIVDVANARLVARMVEGAILDLRTRLFASILARPPNDQEYTRGDCMNRFVNDLNRLHSELSFTFGKFLKEPLIIFSCLLGAMFFAWRLVFVAFVVVPIASWLMYRLAHRLRKAHFATADRLSHVVDHLSEATSLLQVVQAFGMESYESVRFKKTAALYARASEKAAVLVAAIGPAFDVLGMLGYSVVILLGGYLVLESQTHLGWLRLSNRPMQLSELLLVVGLLGGIYHPARRMLGMFGRLQAATTASDRVFELLEPPKTTPSIGSRPITEHHSEIRFERLWFGYTENKPILKGLDLCIPFGSILAIVGPNGCGKSTLIALLTRFVNQDSGRILVDGIDIRQFDVAEYRRQIGLVPQHTSLLKESIAENIRYGKQDASRDEIVVAAQQAHIHERITQLPAGYDTPAGNDGNRLSGGERQRIALARALVRNPAVLLLDEVTSHIDYESEQMICQALLASRDTRTTIIVTHQASTLAMANIVAVLDQGQIVACGDHATLFETCDFYRNLMERDPANSRLKAA